MPGTPEIVGETEYARRAALGVMEEDYLGHGAPPERLVTYDP
jgi:hypothetical protein